MTQLRKISLLFFLVVLLISCKTSQKLVDAKPQRLGNALLWQITYNELKDTSYLFGTMHLIDGDSFFWPKRTLEVFESCEEITFEVDLSLMDDVAKQMSLMSKAMMKDDISLSDLITPKEYELVNKHFSKMGLPLFLLERIKPMFLTVFASSNKENVSYELKLLGLAKKLNKTISGLETMEYQLSIFDSIPYKEQAQSLVDAIQMKNDDNNLMTEMVQLYKKEDITALYDMINSEMADSKDQQFLMLDSRNQNWIPIMSNMMRASSHFFAVGAGHLAGEKGLINLLKDKGYQLTPISQTGIMLLPATAVQ